MKEYLMFLLPTVMQILRYTIFAGLAYLIFYVWRKKAWFPYKNQIKYPEKAKMWADFQYSMLTCLIFGGVIVLMLWCNSLGITLMYKNIDTWGVGYFWFSILAIILIHDTYFYWTHRLMHHPKIYKKVHLIHHTSHNPTPWTAFAFHPLEAFIEIGFAPILIFLMPTHLLAWLIFLMYMMLMNVLGHSGFEYNPKSFLKNPVSKWYTTPTHHNMHHQFVHKNYGLYFNFWDRIMGTNHEDYEKTFEKVSKGKNIAETKKEPTTRIKSELLEK